MYDTEGKKGNYSSRETGPDPEAGSFLFPQKFSRWETSYRGNVSRKAFIFSEWQQACTNGGGWH
jgi:hypothetical protein